MTTARAQPRLSITDASSVVVQLRKSQPDSPGIVDLLRNTTLHLTESQSSALTTLWAYDLSFITKQLVSKGDPLDKKPEQLHVLEAMFGTSDRALASSIETEFKRFMSLIVVTPDSAVSPPRGVDMYWHLFVLHTKEYREFSHAVFGKFIDHVPSASETMQTKDASSVYKALFGERSDETLAKSAVADCSHGCTSNPKPDPDR